MRSFEQYDEICKYFAAGKQRDNNTNEIQKHLQLYNLCLGEYLVNKYALWLDFRITDENERKFLPPMHHIHINSLSIHSN